MFHQKVMLVIFVAVLALLVLGEVHLAMLIMLGFLMGREWDRL
jgi:hypothetical protein